jgi:alkaline phosphatase
MGQIIQPEKRSYRYVGGDSLWSRIIAGQAVAGGEGTDGEIWTFTDERKVIQSWMSGETPARVMAIPRVGSTLQEKRGGDRSAAAYEVPFIPNVPTLNEMCRAAINILDEDPEGFFLVVEGGAVDWASHDNLLGRMIEEQIDFNRCVNTAVEWIDENDAWDHSLIIVTADHETGYLHGPGSGNVTRGKRGTQRGVWQPLENHGKGRLPGTEWYSESHTSSLVPFYARGMYAGIFRKYINGVDPERGPYLDQTAIARMLFSRLGGIEED